jgi:STE24 endopeptidase
MSEMTATRMGLQLRLATLAALTGAWAAGLFFLWTSSRVPGDLHLSGLNPRTYFAADLLRDGYRFERFLWVSSLLGIVATIGLFALYARFGTRFVRDSAAGPIGTGMLLAMLGFAFAWLVRLPFSIADVWWERRHDLEASYVEVIFGGWFGLGVLFVFYCVAVLVVMGSARLVGERWWIPGAAFFTSLVALFSFLSPYLVPDTHRVRDPKLVASARTLANKEGVAGTPVEIVDVSGNEVGAFTTGFGPSRKVFVTDTLLDGRFSAREVRFVLAHEFGHQARNHLVKGVAWYAAFAFPIAYLIALVTRRRGGMRQPESIPLALLVLVVLNTAVTPLNALITRHIEAEADWTALETTRDPAAGAKAFQDLGKADLVDPDPPTWAYVWFDDHPTLMQRIAMTRAWAVREAPRGGS